MNIEKITGDYLVLQLEDEFRALQEQFNQIEDYTKKLEFWHEFPYCKEIFEQGSIPVLSMTYYEAYKQSADIQQKDFISVVPSKTEEKILIYWLINLPDSTFVELKEEYDAFDNKEVFIEVRLRDFFALLKEDDFFPRAFSMCAKNNLAYLIDEYRATKFNKRIPLSHFVRTIRETQSWIGFAKYIGYKKAPELLLERRPVDYTIEPEWKGTLIELIIIVKLLHGCGYLGEKISLKEAWGFFGQVFHLEIKQPHSALNKFLENNKDDYKGIMENIEELYYELRAVKNHEKPKKNVPSRK